MFKIIQIKAPLNYAVEESQKFVNLTKRRFDSGLVLIDKFNLLINCIHNPNIRTYLIFAWWGLCLNFHVLLWFLPLGLGCLLCLCVKKSPPAEKTYRDYLNDKRVYSAVNLISELNATRQWLNEWSLFIQNLIPKNQTHILAVTLAILPVWWCLLYFLTISKLVAIGGSLILLEASPSHRFLRFKIVQHLNDILKDFQSKPILQWTNFTHVDENPLPEKAVAEQPTLQVKFIGPSFSLIDTMELDSLKSLLLKNHDAIEFTPPEKQMTIIKQLFENQRSSFYYGWQSTYIDTDPAAWTCEGKSVLPKSLIELPSPIIRPINEEEVDLIGDSSTKVCFYWTWDHDWMLVFNSLTDHEGWSYGDSNWKNFSSQSRKGWLGANTRRKNWQRRATLHHIYFR